MNGKQQIEEMQTKAPVHNEQPNLKRVIERICADGRHAARYEALLSILEMGINQIK